jgi:predicted nucleic acid-binding protein
MATTVVERTFVDTNILIFAHLSLSPFHRAAITRLQELDSGGAELWISRQILREYLSAMTKPGVLTGSIPIPSLLSDVRYFTARFRIAEDGPAVTNNLLTLTETIPLLGKQVHDANIIATMQAYDISKLITHNTADFTRFSSLITVFPLIT